MAIALITGANRGIGLALVKAYAGRRDKVYAAVRALFRPRRSGRISPKPRAAGSR